MHAHFGEAFGEERVQDAEVLAHVDVVVELGVALLHAQRARDLLQVLLHGARLLFEEVVHELHEIFFVLEPGEIGYSVCSVLATSVRSLARIF